MVKRIQIVKAIEMSMIALLLLFSILFLITFVVTPKIAKTKSAMVIEEQKKIIYSWNCEFKRGDLDCRVQSVSEIKNNQSKIFSIFVEAWNRTNEPIPFPNFNWKLESVDGRTYTYISESYPGERTVQPGLSEPVIVEFKIPPYLSKNQLLLYSGSMCQFFWIDLTDAPSSEGVSQ